MFMNCTYAVFMLLASLPEGTRGMTNVGGPKANLSTRGPPFEAHYQYDWYCDPRNGATHQQHYPAVY